MRPMKVVTLPPRLSGAPALDFARQARDAGASVLEVRTDLSGDALDVRALSELLPLLVSERGGEIPRAWAAVARWADVELGTGPHPEGPRPLLSHHAGAPLTTGAAVSLWRSAQVPAEAWVKHVEPLGEVMTAARLFETQRALQSMFGRERVTVLGMGPFALPFRALLSAGNRLDYVALEPSFAAAPGQRLLADAVRADRAGTASPRLGILGTQIQGSCSPRIHPPPFDRIDLPEDTDPVPLVEALTPWYRGFAVTRPFKRRIAAWLSSGDEAVNTLFRRDGRWVGANTDVEGARAVLEVLGSREVTVLGGGGVAPALERAADGLGVRVRVVRRAEADGISVGGAVVWTWPPELSAPRLSLKGARVAVISYGAAGRRIAATIRGLGGEPLPLGARWFVRQARAQRALWSA